MQPVDILGDDGGDVAAALQLGYVTEAEFDRIVDPAKMVGPGVAGTE